MKMNENILIKLIKNIKNLIRESEINIKLDEESKIECKICDCEWCPEICKYYYHNPY